MKNSGKSLCALASTFLLILFFLPRTGAGASTLNVRNTTITDVTPTAFSVVWEANEPSTPSITVFDDAFNDITGTLVITNESAEHPPAEDLGVMKVRVTGLVPDTQYYFQTVTVAKADGTSVIYPDNDNIPVATTLTSVIVDNNLIFIQIFESDGISVAHGTLLSAEVQGALHPVTGWQGDGIPDPYAYVDLNNLYGEATGENLELSGGEAITLRVFGGSSGTLLINGVLPDESGDAFKTLEGLTVEDQTLSPGTPPLPPTGLHVL
jgi:hypothetical protein